jgi:hypothetical protein
MLLPDSLTVQEDQSVLPPPLVLAVVNAQNACAGVVTWTGQGTSLTVWGRTESPDVPSSAATGPLAPGDSLRLRLYDPTAPANRQRIRSAAFILRDHADYLVTRPHFVPNGIYVVDRILVEAPLASDAAPRP